MPNEVEKLQALTQAISDMKTEIVNIGNDTASGPIAKIEKIESAVASAFKKISDKTPTSEDIQKLMPQDGMQEFLEKLMNNIFEGEVIADLIGQNLQDFYETDVAFDEDLDGEYTAPPAPTEVEFEAETPAQQTTQHIEINSQTQKAIEATLRDYLQDINDRLDGKVEPNTPDDDMKSTREELEEESIERSHLLNSRHKINAFIQNNLLREHSYDGMQSQLHSLLQTNIATDDEKYRASEFLEEALQQIKNGRERDQIVEKYNQARETYDTLKDKDPAGANDQLLKMADLAFVMSIKSSDTQQKSEWDEKSKLAMGALVDLAQLKVDLPKPTSPENTDSPQAHKPVVVKKISEVQDISLKEKLMTLSIAIPRSVVEQAKIIVSQGKNAEGKPEPVLNIQKKDEFIFAMQKELDTVLKNIKESITKLPTEESINQFNHLSDQSTKVIAEASNKLMAGTLNNETINKIIACSKSIKDLEKSFSSSGPALQQEQASTPRFKP